MAAERPEQWRAVAKIVAASLLFAVALARAVAFRPAEPRTWASPEAEILDAATTACVAHNGTWFAPQRGILAQDDRQGDYCEVQGPFRGYKHCPVPCQRAAADDRGRHCLAGGGTKTCKAAADPRHLPKPPGPGSYDVEVFIRTYRRDLLGGVLLYTLESVAPYGGTVVRGASLCYPAEDDALFAALPAKFPTLAIRLSPVDAEPGRPLFHDYVHADLHTSAPYVMHLDGDMLLYHELSAGELFDAEASRPFFGSRRGRLRTASAANKPAMDWLGVDALEYTLLGRMVYPREIYAWMRARIRKVHKPLSLAKALRRRGPMDNYSPFGALLLYVHPDAVTVVRHHLRNPYLQIDGRKMTGEWVNVAHCVACHEPTACETAIWDDCKPEKGGPELNRLRW
ncbi:hypothetical protein JL721_2618 [Aureococcus anophagefferens]|nr:hypothetical protein JL721_2618 [Aureococcus anophagefferens]